MSDLEIALGFLVSVALIVGGCLEVKRLFEVGDLGAALFFSLAIGLAALGSVYCVLQCFFDF